MNYYIKIYNFTIQIMNLQSEYKTAENYFKYFLKFKDNEKWKEQNYNKKVNGVCLFYLVKLADIII